MRLLLFLTPFVLFLAGCRSRQEYSSKPGRGAGADNQQIEVNASIYHVNDTATTVYVQLENENLLYKRPDTSNLFYAHLRVACNIFLEGNPRKLVDSSSVQIFDRAGGSTVPLKSLFTTFHARVLFGGNYLLKLDVIDINRRSRYTKEFAVNKASRLGSQNFLVYRNDSVTYKRNFTYPRQVRVQYNDTGLSRLYVQGFLKQFGPALPPFSVKPPDELKYRPDTAFTILREGKSFTVTMPPSGFYHLRADESSQAGLTLFTYEEAFPGVSSSEEMIECARYIMSRDEFEACLNASDRKKAIDDFWLNIGGSVERARELLKRYYGRVKEANRVFTSYTQGWKTDRGMIFIVFGKPVNIYKSKKDEVWVYGNEANPATLRFVFNRTENPYSDNDLIMERSQFYKDPWHTAVDYWRQGHVYLENRR